MKKFLLLFCLFLQSYAVFSKIPVGEWRTHFSYNSANQVAYGNGKVYVEANNKLYSYSTSTGQLETYSTLTGLSGHKVTCITWCEAEKTLIIVYSDGNIDFLTEKGLINLADFKNKSMTADKTVNGIRVDGSKAYLSTGIGLMMIDVAKREISETYYISKTSSYTNVYDVAVLNDTVFVTTESGIYSGNLKDNLLDASSWTSIFFLPNRVQPKQLVRFDNRLLVLADNGVIYKKEEQGWSIYFNNPRTSKIKVQDGYLLVCSGTTIYMFTTTNESQTISNIPSTDVTYDQNLDMLYIASGTQGLTKLSKTETGYQIAEDSITANGPASNVAWKGLFKDGAFYATAGGQAQNWGNRAFYDGDILVFKDEKWSNISNKQEIVEQTKVPFLDLLNLAIDPNDPTHYFATSYGEGLYEFRNNKYSKLYTNKNSPLESSIVGDSSRYIRIDGATFDPDDNLWMLCSNSYNPVQVLLKEGDYTKWATMNYPEMPKTETWNSILFSKRDQVWMNSMREPGGIFVVDSHVTENTQQVQTRWITSMTDQDGNVLSPFWINCITEDLNGAIWLGTVYGPIVANNPSNIFDINYTFTRIKIPRNDGTDNADFLLNNIRINCITVDGANRKWIGTNGNGIYLVSADGTETLHHFDTENSPLPSNYVWSITINPESGEVFMGTYEGLVSYRSDATESSISYDKIHVFPNPVTVGYNGLITVTGLMENSQVSISNLSGNVLIKGTSRGGQFTWDGYTANGKRASSGVYIVFCASEDGTQYQTCKFMIVN